MPRFDTAVQAARDGVVADPEQLPLRLAQLFVTSADEDQRTTAGDQPADPRTDRAVDPDVVAARDVAAIVVTADADIDDCGAIVHHARDLVGGEGGEWRGRVCRWRGPPPLCCPHVLGVRPGAMRVPRPGGESAPPP